MLTVSRKIELIVKANTSAYAKVNQEYIVPGNKIIGSSITAVNKIVSLSNELKVLMPEILGLSPNSADWDRLLVRYWHSLSEPINPTGKVLETGFVYDITDTSKKTYIDGINASLKTAGKKELKSDEDLKNYIYSRLLEVEVAYNEAVLAANKLSEKDKEDALKLAYDQKYASIWAIESDHYKVGNPINTFEYLLWKYCLYYGDVANEFAFANKSTRIRFYLSSEQTRKELERIKIKTKNQAMEKYLQLISSNKDVVDILFAIGKGLEVFELAKTSESEEFDMSTHVLLQKVMDEDPAKFINIASDKNISTKGLIEKYITYNILKRLQGTNIIVDYNNPAVIIGNSLDEAVSFFSNQENAAVISEYETKFKDLNSKL